MSNPADQVFCRRAWRVRMLGGAVVAPGCDVGRRRARLRAEGELGEGRIAESSICAFT